MKSKLGVSVGLVGAALYFAGLFGGMLLLLVLIGYVLLVEDNEQNREITTEILTEYGFSVDTVENGAEALERVSSSSPGEYALIFMDIRMPVMNGIEATRCIRMLDNTELSSIPIVAMTANAFDEDRKTAIECGMNGFISKPLKLNELIQVLDDILGS